MVQMNPSARLESALRLRLTAFLSESELREEMEAAAKKKIYSPHENPPRNLRAIRLIREFLGGPAI